MKRTLLIAILAAFTGLSANAADLSPSERAAGEKLNKTKCARCHKLYQPKDYDPVVWDRWLQKMKRKARLNDADFARLSAYLRSLRDTVNR